MKSFLYFFIAINIANLKLLTNHNEEQIKKLNLIMLKKSVFQKVKEYFTKQLLENHKEKQQNRDLDFQFKDNFEDVKKYNDRMMREFDELDNEVLGSLEHLKNIADLPINETNLNDQEAESVEQEAQEDENDSGQD